MVPRQGLRQPGQSSRGLGTFPCQPLPGVLRGLAIPQPRLLSQANHPEPFPASQTLSKWALPLPYPWSCWGLSRVLGTSAKCHVTEAGTCPPGSPLASPTRGLRCQEGPPVPSGVQSSFRCLTSSALSSVPPMERERPPLPFRSRGFLPPFLWS